MQYTDKAASKMSKNVLLYFSCSLFLYLSITSISFGTCSKPNSEKDKTDVMTTEAATVVESKSTIDSKSDDANSKDDVDLMAVMTMCNESFRIEMSYLIVLNESGSFPDETDKTPKCFLRCVLENLEIASLDDGMLDPSRAAAIFAGVRNGELMEDILEITTYCAQRDETCHCEMAYNFLKCLFSMKIENNAKS